MKIKCDILESIALGAINSNLGSSGGKTYRLRDAAATDNNDGPMPIFLDSKALQPFIYQVFEGADLSPVEYNDNGKIIPAPLEKM